MRTVNDVMANWIKAANEGRIKVGKRELTKDESTLCIELLQCVAADLSMLEKKP